MRTLKETRAEQEWRGLDCFTRDWIGLQEIFLRRLDNLFGEKCWHCLRGPELNAVWDAMRHVPHESKPSVALFAGEVAFAILIGIRLAINQLKDGRAASWQKIILDRETLTWMDPESRTKLARIGTKYLLKSRK